MQAKRVPKDDLEALARAPPARSLVPKGSLWERMPHLSGSVRLTVRKETLPAFKWDSLFHIINGDDGLHEPLETAVKDADAGTGGSCSSIAPPRPRLTLRGRGTRVPPPPPVPAHGAGAATAVRREVARSWRRHVVHRAPYPALLLASLFSPLPRRAMGERCWRRQVGHREPRSYRPPSSFLFLPGVRVRAVRRSFAFCSAGLDCTVARCSAPFCFGVGPWLNSDALVRPSALVPASPALAATPRFGSARGLG